jgi:GLPGLI family protein
MKILAYLSVVLFSAPIFAQNTSGTITYEEKFNIHKRMTGERAKYKDFVPEFRITKGMLVFDESSARYADREVITGIEEEVVTEENSMRAMMKSMAPKNEFFMDFKKDKFIEFREFLGREFLVQGDKVEQAKWKIVPEQKEIKGYIAQKAELTNEEGQLVVAWFTPQIPVSIGPATYNKLPGLILEVNINDGDLVISALEITLNEVNKDYLIAPKKGKKVTPDEFQAIVKEKMEEMRESGQGGGMHIRTRSH